MILLLSFIGHYLLHEIRITILSIWEITVNYKIIPLLRNTPSLEIKKILLLKAFLWFLYLLSSYKLFLYQKSPNFAILLEVLFKLTIVYLLLPFHLVSWQISDYSSLLSNEIS